MNRNPLVSSVIPVDRVRQTFADVFEVPVEEITMDSSPDTVESWDSINHLNLVMALEQEFGVEFDPEDIEQLLSVPLTIEMLEKKLAGAS
jgi:acyl carrier protein